MKPVFQTKKGMMGNCLSASLASVLELPLEEVPVFLPTVEHPEDGEPQMLAMQRWLETRGLWLLELAWPLPICGASLVKPRLVLGTVKSLLGEGYTHSLVGELRRAGDRMEFHVVHDPNGDRQERYELLYVGFLMPLSIVR